nr:titin [Hymenolepis microstoma]
METVAESITCLDQALTASSSKINLLSEEVSRLKVLLDSVNDSYYYKIENEFREVCQLTANAQQIMNLRKLVLFKERRFLECEGKINSKIESLIAIEYEADSIYENECVGKTACEAGTLVKSYRSFEDKLQIAYDDCQRLFKIYKKMCAIDGRHPMKNVSSAKSRLSKLFTNIGKKIAGMIAIASSAESFYTASDNLLEAARNAILQISAQNQEENDSAKLEELLGNFKGVQVIASQILSNIGKYQEKKTKTLGELTTHIQLKIYTICLKLQEFERKVTGNVSDLFKCPCDFTPSWYHNQSSGLANQHRRLAHSLSQMNRYSSSFHSDRPLPQKVSKYRLGGSDSNYYNIGKKDHNAIELSADCTIPKSLSSVDLTMEGTEMLENKTNAAEWRRLGPPVNNADDREVSARSSNPRDTQLPTSNDDGHQQMLHLISRIKEVEEDLSVCKQQLNGYVDAACCRNEGDITVDYIRKLETIREEVTNLRRIVPAQEAFIASLESKVSTAFNGGNPAEMIKLQQDWEEYLKEMSKFENILPNLIQSSKLLAAAHQFTLTLQSKFDNFAQDSECLTDIQQEAVRLQENIEKHLNTTEIPLSPIGNNSSLPWVLNELQTVLGSLQEAGEEAEMMATNLNDQIGHNEEDEPKQSPLLYFNDTYPGGQEDGGEDELNEEYQEENLDYATEDPYLIGDDSQANTPPQPGVMNAHPGGSITIHLNFGGFNEDMEVKWTFVPSYNAPEDDESFPESFLESTTKPITDMNTASLLIPCVFYKHAGEYFVTITDPRTGKELKSSSKLNVKAELKRGLTDLKAIIDGDKCKITGKDVTFFVEYAGFDKIPSKVVWLHDGKPIDQTKWTLSISPLTTRIKSDCLSSVDAGQYTCRVSDENLGINMESSAVLKVQNSLDNPRPASRASSRTGTPAGDDQSPITKALENSSLSLKCPLPSVASEAFDNARQIRMQWFRDGTQLFDSEWQSPDYFTGSQGVTFVDGKTFWKVGMTEDRAVMLNTKRIRPVDAGRYSCLVRIDKDAYESSGVVAVYSSQQFVEQLKGAKVYLGEPAELRCRLEPWITGNSAEEDTKITWYHFDTVLTPELQELVGIVTSCQDGLCTLQIKKTSRRYGGVYKCEAKNEFGICSTSCRLLLDMPVPPTVIGSIQRIHEENDEDENVAILRVEYDAVPQPTVSWLKDGRCIKQGAKYEIITAQEESVLRVIDPSATENGTYSAVIKNVAGVANSSGRFEFDGGVKRSQPPTNNKSNRRTSFEPEDNFSQESDRKSSTSSQPIPNNSSPEKSQSLERRSSSIIPEYRREVNYRRPSFFMNDKPSRRTSFEPEDNFPQKGSEISSTPPPIPKKRSEIPFTYTCDFGQETEPIVRRVSGSSYTVPVEKKNPITYHQTQTADDRENEVVFDDTFCTPIEKKCEPMNSAPPQNSPPLVPSSLKSNQDQNYGKAFLLRPQSIIAKVGETAVFSCVIRPPSGAPVIHRVIWRRDNCEIGDDVNESPRVTAKANEPYKGVFQLKVTDIKEGDHGAYEVVALDGDNMEICSATFHLSVDGEKAYEGSRDRSAWSDEMYLDSPRLPPLVTVGVGELLEVTCFISGYPLPQVFWFKDGQQLNEHDPDNDFQIKKHGHVYQLIIPSAQPRHEGLWEVIGRNVSGLVMSGSIVHVKIPSRLRSNSMSSERSLHASSSMTLQDRRASNRSLSLSDSSQKRILLQSNQKAPEFKQYFHDQIVNIGDNVRFRCIIEGTPKPDIRWEHNGQEIQQSGIRSFQINNSDTAHELVLSSVDTEFAGRYTVIAENHLGLAACSAILTVHRAVAKGHELSKESGRSCEAPLPRSSPNTIHLSPRVESPEFRFDTSSLDEYSYSVTQNTRM